MIDVKGLYKKYASGERLTYDERSAIVSFDKSTSDWDKLNIRLDALYELRAQGESVSDNIQELESLLRSGEGISDVLSKEYYEMSTKEKPSSRVSSDKKEPTNNKMKEIHQSFQYLKDYTIEDERPVPAFNGYDDELGVESVELEGKRNSDGSYSFSSKTKAEFQNTDLNRIDTFGFTMNITDTELQVQINSNKSLNQLSGVGSTDNDKVAGLTQSDDYKVSLNQLSETELTKVSEFLDVKKRTNFNSFYKFETKELVFFTILIDTLKENKRTEMNKYLDPHAEYAKYTREEPMSEKDFEAIKKFDKEVSDQLKIDMRKAVLLNRKIYDKFDTNEKRSQLNSIKIDSFYGKTEELDKYIESEYSEMSKNGIYKEEKMEELQDGFETNVKISTIDYQDEYNNLVNKLYDINLSEQENLKSDIERLKKPFLGSLFNSSEIKKKEARIAENVEEAKGYESYKDMEAKFSVSFKETEVFNMKEFGYDIASLFKNQLKTFSEKSNKYNLDEYTKLVSDIMTSTRVMNDRLEEHPITIPSPDSYLDAVRGAVAYENFLFNEKFNQEQSDERYPHEWKPKVNDRDVTNYFKESLATNLINNSEIFLEDYLDRNLDYKMLDTFEEKIQLNNKNTNPEKIMTLVDDISSVFNEDFTKNIGELVSEIENNFSSNILEGKTLDSQLQEEAIKNEKILIDNWNKEMENSTLESQSIDDSKTIGKSPEEYAEMDKQIKMSMEMEATDYFNSPEIQINLGNQTIKSVGKTESQKNGNTEININLGDSGVRSDQSYSGNVNTGIQKNIQINNNSKTYVNNNSGPNFSIGDITNSNITSVKIGDYTNSYTTGSVIDVFNNDTDSFEVNSEYNQSSSMNVNTGVQENVQVNTDSTKSFTNTNKSPEVIINMVNSKITNSIIGKDNGRGRE